MDIRRWLEETAEAKAPLGPPRVPGQDFFHRLENPKQVFDRKGAQKQGKSDSSLLEPQPQSHQAPLARPKPLTEQPSGASAYSKTSHPSHCDSTDSESASQRYARKPRRKTRLERYEPSVKQKERGKHVHQSRKDESKKSRRKSKRKKGEKAGSAIAQTFHAKNVSGDRLTLKPREQLGIFNKGKTSTAVRGRGLPDLVFSEMRFLQKAEDQSEPALPHEPPKKKRKKDRQQTKEGEISAFFTSVRPVLAERDSNSTLKHNQGGGSAKAAPSLHELDRERAQSTKSTGVLPTIETPGQASYLGFGSRGPRHESTGYVSWSDSVRAPDAAPPRPNPIPDISRCQHETSNNRVDKATATADDEILRIPAPASVTKQRARGSAERFKVSSVETSQHRIPRSHSYPQQTSSPRKMNLVDRAAKFQSTESVESPSSMPPVVTRHASAEHQRRRPMAKARATSSEEYDIPHANDEQMRTDAVGSNEHEDPETDPSSDLGRVIQQCKQTFHERRRASEPRERHSIRPATDLTGRPSGLSHHLGAHRQPTVRFTGIDSPRVPNFPGASIYEQQADRQQLQQTMSYDDEQFMADGIVDEQTYDNEDGSMLFDETEWEAYPDDEAPHDLGAIGVVDDYASEGIVRPLASENSVVAPGFWRPNKLY